MFIAKTLSFYKRPEIRQALVDHAEHKEISVHFANYFGKRPEVLFSDGDVLEFAKKKATSFHASEELWMNPLQIKTGMKKNDVNELRIGWDLILDIDCPYWPLSKLITHLFIKALKAHGIDAVTVKFSGNKGFHIAVPFESFPETTNGEPTKDQFPEIPRRIAHYLLDYLTDPVNGLIEKKDDHLLFKDSDARRSYKISFKTIQDKLGISKDDIFETYCPTCNSVVEKKSASFSYLCNSCGFTSREKEQRKSLKCPRCGSFLQEDVDRPINICNCYKKFTGHDDPRLKESLSTHYERLKILKIIEVDTILIAHRHLYRMPYSFHEKSQLVSVPIPIDKVLTFSKKDAVPEKVDLSVPFLDRTAAKKGEASKLLIAAYDFEPKITPEELAEKKTYEIPETALSEEVFPPCMKNILKGLKDGRKRALFTLINFLRGCGWSLEQIEDRINEWNQQNDEPLREVIIKGRISYEKTKKIPLPPHNCKQYYQDLGVCKPDKFCMGCKNPLQYAKKVAKKQGIGVGKPVRARLTEEQKKMRKKFREKKKGEKENLQ